MTTDWKPELIARYRELSKGPTRMPTIDEDIEKLDDVIRRANIAQHLGYYEHARQLIAEAKELIKRIDPDLQPPTRQ